jgi:type IV conjugative transfer system protein TraE
MLLGNLIGAQDKLKYMCTVLVVLVCLLLVCNLIEGFLLYSLARSKRTIITPSYLAASMEVSDTDGDPSYIRQIAIYAIGLLYQYTPYNATDRFQEFLVNFVPAKNIDLLRAQLQDRLRKIQETKVSESFHIEEVVFEKKNTLLMSGVLNRYTAGQQVGNEKIYLEIHYQVINGGFRIEVITNVSAQNYNARLRSLTNAGRAAAKSVDQRNKRVQEQQTVDTAQDPDESDDFSDVDDTSPGLGGGSQVLGPAQ